MLADTEISLELIASSSSFYSMQFHTEYLRKIPKLRSSIKPAERPRLAVMLRYLATGETFKSLEYSFRISRTMISSIVIECAGYATLSSSPLLSY